MLKQIGISSFWLFLSRILTQLLHLVFIGIIARSLGVEEFGNYVLFALILYIGNIFTTYGTDALLIREISPTGKISASFSASAWLQVGLSILWLFILLVVSMVLNLDPLARNSLLILNLGLIPLAFQSVVSSVLRSFDRTDMYFAIGVLSLTLHTTFAFLFIKKPDDLLLLCTMLLVDKIFIATLGLFLCRRLVSESIVIQKPVFSEIYKIFRSSWKLAAFFPLSALQEKLNLFVVYFISGQALTGVFSASTRLMDGVKIGHFSISNSMMPMMSKSESNQVQETLKKSLTLLLIWSLFVSVGIYFFGDILIEIVYSSAYLDSSPAFKIIGFVLIPYTFSIYFSLNLIMIGKEKLVLRATSINLIIALIVYVILISNFGIIGAAWGTLINELTYASLLAWIGKRQKENL